MLDNIHEQTDLVRVNWRPLGIISKCLQFHSSIITKFLDSSKFLWKFSAVQNGGLARDQLVSAKFPQQGASITSRDADPSIPEAGPYDRRPTGKPGRWAPHSGDISEQCCLVWDFSSIAFLLDGKISSQRIDWPQRAHFIPQESTRLRLIIAITMYCWISAIHRWWCNFHGTLSLITYHMVLCPHWCIYHSTC